MNEWKNCLKQLGVFYLLMAINILPTGGIIPERFPLQRISSLYLFALTVCLLLHYYRRISQHPRLKGLMLTIAYMEMFFILLRGIKYSVFEDAFFLGRYCWYLYYVPMLACPVLLFYLSVFIHAKDERQIERKWCWAAVVTGILILGVLTNDLHQLVFRFRPGFENWDSEYSYGWLFPVMMAWQYGFCFAAVAVLIVKCNISNVRNHAWVLLIPFTVGIATILLLTTDTMPRLNGTHVLEFPEAFCLMLAGVLECCMQLGMIPTNKSYRKLMKEAPVRVQITDRSGTVIYKSDAAKELTEEQFSAPDKTRIGEHTILRKMEISGGYGFWENDVTELDKLNEELADAGEALSEEAEIVRLQNELKEKQVKIEQRTAVYDAIARRTQKQSLAISRISEQARNAADPLVKDRCRKQIAMLGAYIKRYANLMLLSESSREVSVNELELSVAEVLRYLNRYGIPGELLSSVEGTVPAAEALAAMEAFEDLLESCLPDLTGAFVNLDAENGGFVFRLTLENMKTDIPASVAENLRKSGIQTAAEYEDHVGYISFVFPKGGDAA